MLIAAVRGKHVDPRHVIFPTELVVRQSCGTGLVSLRRSSS
jgi:DNA-binding LacI/PurR family transcriptional regulator